MARRTWKKLPSNTRYDCDPWERQWVGKVVPGHRGGTITACATPGKRYPKRGQVWIGPARGGHPMPKPVATRRMRGMKMRADSTAVIAAAVALYDQYGIPQPMGLEFPHRPGSSVCDPEHPVWNGYEKAMRDAQDYAEEQMLQGDRRAPERIVLEALERHRSFRKWDEISSGCAHGFKQRYGGGRKARHSSQRESAQHRTRSAAAGLDLTAAEYLDTLAPSSRAKALRRMGRVAEARDLERSIRSKRRR